MRGIEPADVRSAREEYDTLVVFQCPVVFYIKHCLRQLLLGVGTGCDGARL